MIRGSLRTRFLLSLVLISALITSATLLLVRQRVLVHAREEIVQGLHNSVVTFQSLQRQRQSTLARSAELLATLPPLKAVMTSEDTVTIQDASRTFWNMSGSQLLVLADRSGKVMGLHTAAPGLTQAAAQDSLSLSLTKGESEDWWFGGGRLFEVFLQPVYFGSPGENTPLGILAVGYEVDDRVAEDVSRVASSRVAIQYGNTLVVTTVPAAQKADLTKRLTEAADANAQPREVQLAAERYLATSVKLSSGNRFPVTLTVLKSYDEATAYLIRLNRWIVGVGFAGVLAGSVLVFLVSTTFTRPLARLVAGVQALEQGDYAYPLGGGGGDEVSMLTAAFGRMRTRLLETQEQLLAAERLATIGRMARLISHDLRHPLTAILGYAEFLSESGLTDAQRIDFYEEIRIAVNRMTDEINALLGFSKQHEGLKLAEGRFQEVIERAIQTMKILPEFETVAITFSHEGECPTRFDADQVERAVLNLLFNAGEAVAPGSGRIDVSSRASERGIEIRVADNGPGIPDSIRESIFEPFVTYGKARGIGLGLTAVKKIMLDHGGEVCVERTGPDGTTFKLFFPARRPTETPARA